MEYIWDIKSLSCGHINGMENVIRQVVFSIGANNNGNIIEVHNSVGLNTPNAGDSFIAFANVTQSNIQEWVTEQVGQDTINHIISLVDAQIQTKKEDMIVHNPPWKNTPSLT